MPSLKFFSGQFNSQHFYFSAELYNLIKIFMSFFYSREHVKEEVTWVILRSFGYASLISYPHNT